MYCKNLLYLLYKIKTLIKTTVMKAIDSKKLYWYLPLDNYGQPSGDIKMVWLTDEQFKDIKNNVFSPYYYCYKEYADALWRSQQ